MVEFHPEQLLVRLRAGSHLHGTVTENSDIDMRTVFIPDGRSIVLQTARKSDDTASGRADRRRSVPGEFEERGYSLLRFMTLASLGAPDALDMLFSPDAAAVGLTHPVWKQLRSQREKVICRKMSSLLSFMAAKARQYVVERHPGDIDCRDVAHAIRIGGQAVELLSTGNITFPRPNAEFLISVKTGEVPYHQAAFYVQKFAVEVEAWKDSTFLPQVPDAVWMDDFIAEAYADQIIS